MPTDKTTFPVRSLELACSTITGMPDLPSLFPPSQQWDGLPISYGGQTACRALAPTIMRGSLNVTDTTTTTTTTTTKDEFVINFGAGPQNSLALSRERKSPTTVGIKKGRHAWGPGPGLRVAVASRSVGLSICLAAPY